MVSGHLLWGNGAEFAQHAVRFLHKTQKSLGDIFTIRLLNQYMTMVMDPHCFEQFAKEKNFSFDPIQKQVNANVFGFELKEARKMISEAGKKVNGRYISIGMESFAENLTLAFEGMRRKAGAEQKQAEVGGGSGSSSGSPSQWSEGGLRRFTASTIFNALFYTVFGRDSEQVQQKGMAEAGAEVRRDFSPEAYHECFEKFHKFFNYLWLGVPVNVFPKACEALKVLCNQPLAHDMLSRQGVSDYIKFSTRYMLEHEQSMQDIVGHNLVFMHVNYNTFRVNYWCVYHLLEHKLVREALARELEEIIESKQAEGAEDQVGFTLEEFDHLPLLGECRAFASLL